MLSIKRAVNIGKYPYGPTFDLSPLGIPAIRSWHRQGVHRHEKEQVHPGEDHWDSQASRSRDDGSVSVRQHGMSDATFYKWRSKYGGMDASEARRLRGLEEENQRLKRLVAEQAMDIQVLKDVLGKTGRARRTALGRALCH